MFVEITRLIAACPQCLFCQETLSLQLPSIKQDFTRLAWRYGAIASASNFDTHKEASVSLFSNKVRFCNIAVCDIIAILKLLTFSFLAWETGANFSSNFSLCLALWCLWMLVVLITATVSWHIKHRGLAKRSIKINSIVQSNSRPPLFSVLAIINMPIYRSILSNTELLVSIFIGKSQEVNSQWNADVITCISTLPNESCRRMWYNRSTCWYNA